MLLGGISSRLRELKVSVHSPEEWRGCRFFFLEMRQGVDQEKVPSLRWQFHSPSLQEAQAVVLFFTKVNYSITL